MMKIQLKSTKNLLSLLLFALGLTTQTYAASRTVVLFGDTASTFVNGTVNGVTLEYGDGGADSKAISCLSTTKYKYFKYNGGNAYANFTLTSTTEKIDKIEIVWMSGTSSQLAPIMYGEAISTPSDDDDPYTVTNGGVASTSTIASSGGCTTDIITFPVGVFVNTLKITRDMYLDATHTANTLYSTLSVMTKAKDDYTTIIGSNGKAWYLGQITFYISDILTPDSKTVSGTATICNGGSTNITLANSQTNVVYDLYKAGISTGVTKTGDGSTLTWPVTAAGTYTIKTVKANSYSAVLMSGSAVISVNNLPTTADAGTDQTGVNAIMDYTVLTANTPSSGVGTWSVYSGPSTNNTQFSSTSNPTATFTPDIAGTYELQWEISSDPCTASSDLVAIEAKQSNNANITGFSFGDPSNEKLFIDQTNNTITITIGAAAILTNANPTVTKHKAATYTSVDPTTYTLAAYISGQTITVRAENGVDTKTYTVKVIQDITNPTITSSIPANSGTDVSLSGVLKLTLDENIKSFTTGSITITDGTTSTVLTANTISTDGTKTVIIPFSGLISLKTYTVNIAAGAFTDMYGNPSDTHSFVFTAADDVYRFLNKNYYAMCEDRGDYGFALPAFIQGGKYNETADTKAATSSQYGAYELKIGESLIIKASEVGEIVINVYALGSRTFSVTDNQSGLVATTGYFSNYENKGTSLKRTINSSSETTITVANTSTGTIYIPYVYISKNGVVAIDETTQCCK